MQRQIWIALLVTIFVSLCVHAQAPLLEITPNPIVLLKDQSLHFVVPDGIAATDLASTDTSPHVELQLSDLSVKGLSRGDAEFTIIYTPAQQSVKLVVRVVEIANFSVDGYEPYMVQGTRRTITLRATDSQGNELSDLPLQLKPETDNIVNVEGGTTLVAVAKFTESKPQETSVNVQMNDEDVVINDQPVKFTIRVAEAIKEVVPGKQIEIAERGVADLRFFDLKLIGRDGNQYEAGTRPLLIAGGDYLELKDNRYLHASELPTIATEREQKVTFTSPDAFPGSPVQAALVSVTITLRPHRLGIEPSVASLPRNGSVVVGATLYDRAGNAEKYFDVNWSLAKPSDEEYFALSEDTNRSVRVIWRDVVTEAKEFERPELIELIASAQMPGPGSEPITARSLVKLLPKVADFVQLRVKLNIMDDRTVADLFGQTTSKEFYVARVRINNNLKRINEKGEPEGESILAFSDSIEVTVGLQKRQGIRRGWWDRDKVNVDRT